MALLDHYAVLGLSHSATPEQIKKAFHNSALKHHPDKNAATILAEKGEAARQAKKKEIEAHFNKISQAYEVLSDPVKRKIFDSKQVHHSNIYHSTTTPAAAAAAKADDDFKQCTIPMKCAPEDFFKEFGPVFKKFARWSVKQPVPDLGHERTPIEEVEKFYEFWKNLSCIDLRVKLLVTVAYRQDPRIIRTRDAEISRAEKEKRKMAATMREAEEAEKRAAKAKLEQRKIRENERRVQWDYIKSKAETIEKNEELTRRFPEQKIVEDHQKQGESSLRTRLYDGDENGLSSSSGSMKNNMNQYCKKRFASLKNNLSEKCGSVANYGTILHMGNLNFRKFRSEY